MKWPNDTAQQRATNDVPSREDAAGALAAAPCSPDDVLRIRCIRHINIPQQNTAESTGAECGGCIAEKLQRLTEQIERYASSIAWGAPLTNQEVSDSLRRITAEANVESIRAEIKP